MLDHSPLEGESNGRRPIRGGWGECKTLHATTEHHPNSRVNQEPPTSSLRSLTPPKGESVQKKTPLPLRGGE